MTHYIDPYDTHIEHKKMVNVCTAITSIKTPVKSAQQSYLNLSDSCVLKTEQCCQEKDSWNNTFCDAVLKKIGFLTPLSQYILLPGVQLYKVHGKKCISGFSSFNE